MLVSRVDLECKASKGTHESIVHLPKILAPTNKLISSPVIVIIKSRGAVNKVFSQKDSTETLDF